MTTTASDKPAIVGDALTRHYAEHGLPLDGGASSPWFAVHIGPLTLRLPNPPARRRAVFFHDVNHVLTGYDTTFGRGEVAIAAFEVASGCGTVWIAWYINLSMLAIGLVANPRMVFRAFVRGRRTTSVYRRRDEPNALAAMPVQSLRAALRIDASTSAPNPGDWVRFGVWSIVGVIVLLAPFAVAAMMVAGLIHVAGVHFR